MRDDEYGVPHLAYRFGRMEPIEDGRVPAEFEAIYDTDEFRVRLSIAVRDGKARLMALVLQPIEPAEEIARATFGGIPLRRLIDRAIGEARHVSTAPGRLVPSPREAVGRREMTAGFLREVARIMVEAEAAGIGPTKHVQKVMGAKSYRTAARWVAAARNAHLIPKGEKR